MSRARARTMRTAPRRVDRRASPTLLRACDPAADPRVLARRRSAASFAIAHGHAALRPAHARRWTATWPSLRWRAARVALGRHARHRRRRADPAAPLVLEGDLLYLRRYREYERRLAAGPAAHRRGTRSTSATSTPLAPLFAQLFPAAAGARRRTRRAPPRWRCAHPLLLVTGGPGTGKTTTIARLLVLLVAQRAAPDGRCRASRWPRRPAAPPSAWRRACARGRRRDARVPASMPRCAMRCRPQARTLHRLLGTIPDRPRFRHDADHPLPFDVVVVDEASMVDLPLMCKLVEAVADGARLVLLGDRDQLPSVEAGDVLAAIVDAAGARRCECRRRCSAARTAARATATGDRFAAPTPRRSRAIASHLQRGYRQSAALDLAPLADAVRAGDADTALALLRGGTLRGVHFHEGLRRSARRRRRATRCSRHGARSAQCARRSGARRSRSPAARAC